MPLWYAHHTHSLHSHIASDVRRASPEMSDEKVAALPLTERIRYHATMVCTPHTLPTLTYRL